ncbi:MAG: hypothetical protein P8Z80_01645 [Pseudolabrys sp.]
MASPRSIDCAFALTAPEDPVARNRAIRVEGGRIAAEGPVEPWLVLPAPAR